jgi:ribonuclease kappa
VLRHIVLSRGKNTMLTLLQTGSHEVMGGEEDPKDGAAVAGAVFGAVFIYLVCVTSEQTALSTATNECQGFIVFCGFQALLHNRESRRGAISLS